MWHYLTKKTYIMKHVNEYVDSALSRTDGEDKAQNFFKLSKSMILTYRGMDKEAVLIFPA